MSTAEEDVPTWRLSRFLVMALIMDRICRYLLYIGLLMTMRCWLGGLWIHSSAWWHVLTPLPQLSWMTSTLTLNILSFNTMVISPLRTSTRPCLACAMANSVIQILIALKWSLVLFLILLISILSVNWWEISLVGRLSFLIGNLLTIEFDELWQSFGNKRPVQTVMRARIVTEPQYFQILKFFQVMNLFQVTNEVFPQV